MRRRPDSSGTAAAGEVMTPEQVAEYLQLNRLTVYRYIREGKIPASRIGKLYRIMKADVDQFLEAQRVSGKRTLPRRPVPVDPAPQRPAAAPPPRQPRDVREVSVGPTWKERLIDRSQAVRLRTGFPLDWVMRGLN